jgi:hypothetical protein
MVKVMTGVRAYKLFRQRKNGSLGPLFINRRLVIEPGVWMPAECHPTKGFAVRPGWHCGWRPLAPHLTDRGRVWCEVEIHDYVKLQRPDHQGGLWLLANYLKLVRCLEQTEIETILAVDNPSFF